MDLSAVTILVPGGWVPSTLCRSEMERLRGDLTVRLPGDTQTGEPVIGGGAVFVGEDCPSAASLQAYCGNPVAAPRPAVPAADAAFDRLHRAAGAVIMATAKPTDGIVSRWINRPVSRAISRIVLRFPAIRPVHATIAAGAIGIVMALCLVAGGPGGLVAGAVLFQIASIVDGVDGEIARATYRSSAAGAMIDSLTDAATNLAFIAGVSINLWQRGYSAAAMAGGIGLIILATGTALLGWQAKRRGGAFTFDAVKMHVARTPSIAMRILTWLTMRDFYAAAAAVSILLGFAAPALMAFAAVAAGWLLFVGAVLFRNR